MATPTSGAVPVARSELRTRTALVLEAIALRHQIAVLERSRTRRPCFRRFDRLLWILLSRWWPQWRESLMIVQPETVLRWRRTAGQRFGDIDHAVTGEEGRPRVSSEVRHLITQMARENFLWGAPRIHGELLMLGFSVSQATVSRYLPAPSRRPTQSWRTFLRNQAIAFGHHQYSGGAFRHGVPEACGLFLLGQPDAICGADCEVKRGTLSLACSPNTDADRSKNSSASRSARTRRYAPCPTIGHGAWLLMESATQSSSDRRSDRIFPAGKRNCTATNDKAAGAANQILSRQAFSNHRIAF